MPRRKVRVPISKLDTSGLRIDKHFLRCLMDYQDGKIEGKPVTVKAREIGIPDGFRVDAERLGIMRANFVASRRESEEFMRPIPVLERPDGSVWSYDDAAYIEVFHELAPDANVLCIVIGEERPVRALERPEPERS